MFGSETFMNNIIGIEFGNTIFRDRLQEKINSTQIERITLLDRDKIIEIAP